MSVHGVLEFWQWPTPPHGSGCTVCFWHSTGESEHSRIETEKLRCPSFIFGPSADRVVLVHWPGGFCSILVQSPIYMKSVTRPTEPTVADFRTGFLFYLYHCRYCLQEISPELLTVLAVFSVKHLPTMQIYLAIDQRTRHPPG